VVHNLKAKAARSALHGQGGKELRKERRRKEGK
jgi:hypothetical protein